MLTVAATQLKFQFFTTPKMKFHGIVEEQVQTQEHTRLNWVCEVQQKVKKDTQGTKLSAAFTHSPALRLWGKLLVKC